MPGIRRPSCARPGSSASCWSPRPSTCRAPGCCSRRPGCRWCRRRLISSARRGRFRGQRSAARRVGLHHSYYALHEWLGIAWARLSGV
jgi:hypothetical protein